MLSKMAFRITFYFQKYFFTLVHNNEKSSYEWNCTSSKLCGKSFVSNLQCLYVSHNHQTSEYFCISYDELGALYTAIGTHTLSFPFKFSYHTKTALCSTRLNPWNRFTCKVLLRRCNQSVHTDDVKFYSSLCLCPQRMRSIRDVGVCRSWRLPRGNYPVGITPAAITMAWAAVGISQ